LRSLRRVRGTPFDLFGRAHIRKLERALIAEYRALVLGALQALGPANHDIAVQIAELPDLVRGYEAIKLRGVAAFRARAAELQARLEEKPRGGKVERTIAV
jgi:indolepyruvate ferredoxin oxidoreductase